jgi:uncharacterized phage protein gp47/JayE
MADPINFGVTATGFNKKTFNDIKTDLQTKLYETFGAIRVDEESVFGQLIGVFSEPTSLEWLALESVYNSLNPDTASGFSLDNIVAYIGLKRLEATATTVVGQLIGLNQTIIPAGSEATAIGVNTVFKLDTDVTLTNLGCMAITLDLEYQDNTLYSVTINNTNIFSYTSQPLDVKATVIDALALAINNGDIGVTAGNINNILVISSNNNIHFSLSHNANLSILALTNNGNFTAVDKGNIPLQSGALTNIQTPVSGWVAVNNNNAGITGRNLETDDELRIRRTKSLKVVGSGTIDAIRARLLNISNVTAASITENINDVTSSEGLPPHSFEALVLGGSDQDIGDTIWSAKPAGIKTYGNVAVNVVDTAGKTQIVNFSRPVKLYIYASIVLTKNMSLYPLDGDSRIKDGIVKQIMALDVGEDVIYQSLYQTVYSIPGVTAATIQIGGSLVETPPTLSSANVVVAASQIAVSDINKINIT